MATLLRNVFLAFIFLSLSSVTYAKTYGSLLCHNPNFLCYKVKRGDSWHKLFPDPAKQNLVMRLNRMNTSIYPGMKIAIPKNLDGLSLMDIAPFDKHIAPAPEKRIFVSLSLLAFGAYDEQGDLVYWGPVSGGQGYCPDTGHGCHTAQGTFTIQSKGGAGCYSTKFPVGRGGAPMPYCMFFYRGFALHGSHEVPGYNASHGCVRLFVDDARWLNHNFLSNSQGVRVTISQ